MLPGLGIFLAVLLHKPLDAVSITCSGYTSGQSCSFFEGAEGIVAELGGGGEKLMGGVGEMGGPGHYPHFGFVVASCERADLRPMTDGVMIYGDTEKRVEPLPAPMIPRTQVIDELCSEKPLHDGEWGMATMEVCLAILQSAGEEKEVPLRHQPKSA